MILARALGVAAGLLLIVSFAAPAAADLDVVFVLDTTGSMGGELREVQERVGQLADALAAAREGDRLRYGVVAFRDRKDDYVVRVSPLTGELAATRAFLDELQAGGGGDGPEAVVEALAAAIGDFDWDRSPATERQIFLIGDAPPHLDYDDDPAPEELIAAAREARIVIHSIGCRSLPAEGVTFFRRMAYATEGSYQHIGRVRRPGSGGGPGGGSVDEAGGSLTAAVRESATGTGGLGERGDPTDLVWLRRREGTGSSGVLVRYGGAAGSEQHPDGDALAPCTLEVRLPAGIDLAEEPRAFLGATGLEVALELASFGPGGDPSFDPGAAFGGGTDVFRLPACPAISTPIHVSLGG